jgi:hypothetical protein
MGGMVGLKDKGLFLHVGDPLVLELDGVKKTANALDFNKGLVDLSRYGEFGVKGHIDH